MHLQSNIKIYYKALPLQSNNEFKQKTLKCQRKKMNITLSNINDNKYN